MKRANTILLWGLLAVCLPQWASAQFKSLMRKADKEFELHEFEKAADSYAQALERRSEDVDALTGLANSYRYLNRMAEAADAFEKASRQDEFNLVNYFYYGHTLKALGRYTEARRAYLRYADLDLQVGQHFARSCDFAANQISQLSNFQVAPVRVNSPQSDFGPAFFKERLLFSSARPGLQPPGQDFTHQPFNSLMQAQADPMGNLAVPVPLFPDPQRGVRIGPLAIAPNGMLAAYTKNNFTNGVRPISSSGMDLDLFFAQVDQGGKWSGEIPFTYNSSDHSNGFPAFSPDGRALYFASDREGGLGGYDLYVTYWTGSGWGVPENLGGRVNTPGDELSPYLDGEVLYFASNWHPGFGGYDLFKSERSGNTWGEPRNLGIPLNSPNDDYGFIFNSLQNVGYLTSNRPGGYGNEDIYRVSSTGKSIQVVVRNASDGKPVPFATLDFTSCGRSVYNADVEGKFSFQLPPGMNCQIQVRAEGYQPSAIASTALQQQGEEPFSVLINRDGEIYRGQIVDYATKQPLENVSVEAVNQESGNRVQVNSDASGQYGLALAPNARYVLRYSRAGYRDVSRNVQLNDPSNTSVLGVISLYPTSGAGGLPPDTGLDPDNPDLGGQAVTGNRPGAGEYAIQLAAVRSPSLGKFSKLESEGTLYTIEEGGLYKVRLGTYPDKSQAQQVLSRVKSKGFGSAFLVKEEGTGQVGSVYRGSSPTSASGNFYVQLAAYSNPQNFNAEAVAGLGKVSEAKRRNLVIKYLGPFQTQDQARSALSKAQAAGFTGAYMVERKPDGTYQRLHSN